MPAPMPTAGLGSFQLCPCHYRLFSPSYLQSNVVLATPQPWGVLPASVLKSGSQEMHSATAATSARPLLPRCSTGKDSSQWGAILRLDISRLHPCSSLPPLTAAWPQLPPPMRSYARAGQFPAVPELQLWGSGEKWPECHFADIFSQCSSPPAGICTHASVKEQGDWEKQQWCGHSSQLPCPRLHAGKTPCHWCTMEAT